MHEDADEASALRVDFVAVRRFGTKNGPPIMKFDISPPLSMSFLPGIFLERLKQVWLHGFGAGLRPSNRERVFPKSLRLTLPQGLYRGGVSRGSLRLS